MQTVRSHALKETYLIVLQRYDHDRVLQHFQALENGEATEQPLLLEYPGQETDAEQTNGASSGIEAEMASALHDSQLHSIAQVQRSQHKWPGCKCMWACFRKSAHG